MTNEFENLLGRYWDLAYLEGKSGISQGDKANEVLSALKKLAEQPAPVQQEPCAWTRPDSDHMPDTWEASCGAMWTFTEGGPKDNDMHFCPKCGKPAIEAAHGIKENT